MGGGGGQLLARSSTRMQPPAQFQEQRSTAVRELELSQFEPSQTRELLPASQAGQKAQSLQLEQYDAPTAT